MPSGGLGLELAWVRHVEVCCPFASVSSPRPPGTAAPPVWPKGAMRAPEVGCVRGREVWESDIGEGAGSVSPHRHPLFIVYNWRCFCFTQR